MMLASCWELEIGKRWMRPEVSLSQRRWQSSSICFVLSWKEGFLVRWMVEWLSQQKAMGRQGVLLRSLSIYCNHCISQIVVASALYCFSRGSGNHSLFFLTSMK